MTQYGRGRGFLRTVTAGEEAWLFYAPFAACWSSTGSTTFNEKKKERKQIVFFAMTTGSTMFYEIKRKTYFFAMTTVNGRELGFRLENWSLPLHARWREYSFIETTVHSFKFTAAIDARIYLAFTLHVPLPAARC